ncbi:MAG: MGDG synthase family glycosyltransferase [Elusimicrobiota bacterium]
MLLTSVSTGAGHVKAAEAIQEAFIKFYPKVEVKHVNAMDYVTPSFRKAYEAGYSLIVKNVPRFWGKIYEVTEKRNLKGKNSKFIRAIQQWNSARFFHFIDNYKPDLVLSTHFFIPQILSIKKAHSILGISIQTVITDFDLHPSWVHPIVDRYFVAQPGIVGKLLNLGVEPARISVTGIPISQQFLKQVVKSDIFHQLEMKENIPVLLLLSGGEGFISLEQMVRQVINLKIPIQIITVSGKNVVMKKKIDQLKIPAPSKLISLGFVNNMDELLTVADIVVTKPGGLTLSESLSKGAMILMISAIPGQEEKNVEYIQLNHAGLSVFNIEDMVNEIKKLLTSPDTLAHYKEQALKLSRPQAAFEIAKSVVSHIQKGIKIK